MPVIIPAYPAMNSTYNVSISSLKLIKDELERARLICKKSPIIDESMYQELFSEYSFFLDHKNYLQIVCASDDFDHQQVWYGWIESRLRRLIMALEDVPFTKVIPFPGSFNFKHQEKAYCDSFFIGLSFNLPKIPTICEKQVNVSQAINHFMAYVNQD